jgi:hypothetical protein
MGIWLARFLRIGRAFESQPLDGLPYFSILRRLTAMENDKRTNRETSRRYRNEARGDVDSARLLNFIREEPLMCAGAAFAAGFVVGGGLAGDLGLALLGLAARTAVKNTMSDLMSGNRRHRGASDPDADTARDI